MNIEQISLFYPLSSILYWHAIPLINNMKHTSTIIYFGDTPVGYDLIEDGNLYSFKPSILQSDPSGYPEIKVTTCEESLMISVDDENIKEQVCKLIRIASLLKLDGKLSAAS